MTIWLTYQQQNTVFGQRKEIEIYKTRKTTPNNNERNEKKIPRFLLRYALLSVAVEQTPEII
ncbi:hypothetical protein DERP_000766 [Dermatophagoides pteronyssinus]|uniref:Uncharacterized protein n=1 Tax=Dermatophagoides pteronyssinus TaxID=6956 RepID=A0ABQ8J173_DERPT|nr:hypothetical protein DERP_000766 [Dermatophagoides pteronyssinus]